VLPFSKTEALVEYTLFSTKPLEKSAYEEAIKTYLKKFGIYEYKIKEREQGVIPMTAYDFSKENKSNYLKIGIAGGWAKPSTGYTFYNSYKKSKQLVQFIKEGKSLSKFQKKNRFWFYDLLLLDVLSYNNAKGSKIFEALFKKHSPQLILKFLDEETTLLEELKVIFSCPKKPFLKALFKRLFF